MTLTSELINTGSKFLTEFGPILAVGMGLYWLYLLYRRIFESSADPSVRKFTSSSVGSASMLVSGAYASAAIASAIAFLTWPAVVETPSIGYLLVAGVVVHAAFEYDEAREEGA